MSLISLPASAPQKLAGRVILVTGAHGGLGSEAAKACAQAGATVVLLGRKVPKLNRLYDVVAKAGPEPLLYPLDMEGAGPGDYAGLAERLDQALGRLDGVLHCAAEFRGLTPIEHADPLTLAQTVHVGLTAACWLSQACIPLLRQREDAAMVFVVDDPRRVGQAYWGGYGLAQQGRNALVGMLHAEMCNGPVRVSGLRPGPMRSSLRERAYAEEPDMRLLRDPEAYADACVTLLSPEGVVHRGTIWTPAV
ncbi:MAG: SDR family NAD(P)-dependent oxidoreductase [Xanthomonadaceae bacterium]|jgi:NAD(P)-dependent dehydrogenase (short-subunit alcohol dehydrogenase family)|nr:SDR family NAD(P)-dependent oxidoreductase [Xanthomonadaceae bacterium]